MIDINYDIHNSLLMAYRDRPEHLKLCLEQLSTCAHKKPIETIIVDLASTSNTEEIIAPHRERLNIVYCPVAYSDTFWKSKALNYGLEASTGEIITTIDCDMLVHENFLAAIEAAFHKEKQEDSFLTEMTCRTPDFRFYTIGDQDGDYFKLSHQVRLMDEETTRMCRSKLSIFRSAVMNNPDTYEAYRTEFYGVEVGNSQFSIYAQHLFNIGGWNEKFIGYGMEDVAMNMTLDLNGINTKFQTSAPLYHLYHKQNQPKWNGQNFIEQNHQVFNKLKEKQFVPPENSDDWGVFPGLPSASQYLGRPDPDDEPSTPATVKENNSPDGNELV